MTLPDIGFVNAGGLPPGATTVPLEPPVAPVMPPQTQQGYPDPIISGLSEETKEKFVQWLDQWLQELDQAQQDKQREWAKWEEGYRGLPDPAMGKPPFVGGCTDVVPVIAMAVDPIHARLDTGIFKQDPVFTVKPLRKTMVPLAPSLSAFIEAYQKHYLKLRRVASPRLLEETKLGTCVFKTVYDRELCKYKGYDENFKVIEKEEVKYSGPRVYGVSIGDFLFPPNYQDIQDCPVVFERMRTTVEKLRVLEHSKKITNVDKIKDQERVGQRTDLEQAREKAAKHEHSGWMNEIVVYEAWCDYDIDGDNLPERLVATYHAETRTLLQLRYNWYFHQRKPYTVIPYSVANESLYGRGVAEMCYPFQVAITRWQRMASDNAYLANIRMFIAKKNSGIEEVPRLYSGRTFFVDDPTKDFIPFGAADIYPSTLTERQNLFGLVEKTTGLSDYLVGRESPIIGTRATATSTLALIQEGARRVEEVLENIRVGFSEIIEFCVAIWIQYGTDNVEDLFFEADKIAEDVKTFFKMATQSNVNGLIGLELTATDASTSRSATQQMQLAIIQIMMQYLEKLLLAGQGAIQAIQAGVPQYAQMVADVMEAARMMFSDLLKKYDIRNPDDYLPDLRAYLNGTGLLPTEAGQSGEGGAAAGNGGSNGSSAGAPPNGPARTPTATAPATPGSGGQSPIYADLARASQGY